MQAEGGLTSLRRMSIGLSCCKLMAVAMGSAVYGTPHKQSNFSSATLANMSSDTWPQQLQPNSPNAGRQKAIKQGMSAWRDSLWTLLRACSVVAILDRHQFNWPGA